MKVLRTNISLLLIVTFSIGIVWQTATVVDFYINRVKITEKYCVNKDKPQMNCKGKCHLKKQLIKTNTTQAETTKSISSLSFWFFGLELISEFVFSKVDSHDHISFPRKMGVCSSFNDKQFLPPDFIF